MKLEDIISHLTDTPPNREQAQQQLRKALTLADHELTDDIDAVPQIRRILSAILHRDLTTGDVDEAMALTRAVSDITAGENLNPYMDYDADRYIVLDQCKHSLNAVIYEVTYGMKDRAAS
ncbi:hypothetical protein [Arthrobacter roseus]|uniref:hypothetical protein n=1 Tax=Arthrobacter roseus TaxID=136274 RepID=UPI001964667F|nr:hypothetical protein [Arthrobacter roseus]MBM7847506.1 hypothetical protein [Arthrobacter roseus]